MFLLLVILIIVDWVRGLGACCSIPQLRISGISHCADSETCIRLQVYLINEWLLERDDQTAWITLIAGEEPGTP